MTMKTASDIRTLSSLCGKLYCLSYMEGATITKAMAIDLECAAERLEAYIGDLIAEDVKSHEGTNEAFDIIP